MPRNKPKRTILGRLSTTTGKTILIIIVVLLCIRILLPYVVLHHTNKTLANDMPGYYGHVNDIDIWLIRGAYQINNIYINKLDSNTQKQTPFFKCNVIDLSVEWRALLHGSVVGELEFRQPWLLFTKDKTDPEKVKEDTSDFRVVLKKLMPLKINRFEVTNGFIEYADPVASPPVDLVMTDTYILAQNLKNSYKVGETLPATVKASAGLYEGTVDFNMRTNPLADRPTFELDAELKNTNLVKMNPFFQAYGGFDVERGRFGLYTEMAAYQGKFKGYVKPIIKDLKVLGPEDRHNSILQKAWEALVGAVAMVFKNQPKDQVATKVPIQGDFNNPSTDFLTAILMVLSNAFIHALMPSIDNEISLQSVAQAPEKKGFFEKVKETFSGNKEDKADKNKRSTKDEKKKPKNQDNSTVKK